MTTCESCLNDMTTAAGCTVDALHRDGRPVPVFRHGAGPGWPDDGRCAGCGVAPGGFHHLGCDAQRCPDCRRLLRSCGCPWDERDGGALPSAQPVPAPRPTVPFEAVVAPVRARHHEALRALAEWAIAAGRPVDLDVAALCIDALAEHDGPDGLRLDRPTVNWVQWGAVRNLASGLGTSMPEDWNVHLWTVLVWSHAAGRFDSASEPLPVLLEPLRCYGGLGEDGRPMPPGVDVDFPCQCYLPHDPTLLAGLASHVVGQDPDSFADFVVRIHPQLRSQEPPFSSYVPLLRFGRRLRDDDRVMEIDALDWTHAGRTDAAAAVPELWLYRYDPTSRRGFDTLAVDLAGYPWQPKADRRRRAGFRWIAGDDIGSLLRAGVPFPTRAPEAMPTVADWPSDGGTATGIDGRGPWLSVVRDPLASRS